MPATFNALRRTSGALFKRGMWRDPSLKARFWLQGIAHFRTVGRMSTHTGFGNLAEVAKKDERFFGVLIWPLIDARWEVDRRLAELQRHYQEVASIGSLLDLLPGESKTMLRLDDVNPALNLRIERPPWFTREGQLTLSIFYEDQRVYSVAFLLSKAYGQRVAYVGAVQGVKQADDSDLYKTITKDAHGLRPRDLVISLFLVLCESLGVREVLAVQDRYRQHRHSYFGPSGNPKVFADYDEIWKEHGSFLNLNGLHSLPPGVRMKPMESIPSKKRSVYRKRYHFLNESRAHFVQAVQASHRPQDRRQQVRVSTVKHGFASNTIRSVNLARKKWVEGLRHTVVGSWLWTCPVMFM